LRKISASQNNSENKSSVDSVSGLAKAEQPQILPNHCYNRYTIDGPRTAINDSIYKIEVYTVENFDASHPAGSDISDLIECRYISYYDYIQSGYKKEDKDVGQYIDMTEYWGIEGAKMLKDELTKINNRNTKLIAPTLVLKFKKEPENKGKFQFNLVFHLEEKEIKDSIEYEF
jgi:hypothetical protein